jgi:hypothetical protein
VAGPQVFFSMVDGYSQAQAVHFLQEARSSSLQDLHGLGGGGNQ